MSLIPIKTFITCLKPYYPPVNYKMARDWVNSGILPTWARIGKGRIFVKSTGLDKFLSKLELSDETIKLLLRELHTFE